MRLVDGQDDILLHNPLETRGIDFNEVGPNRKILDEILPVGSCCGRSGEPGVDIGRFDAGGSYHGTLCVLYRSGDRSGDLLCIGIRPCAQDQNEQCAEQRVRIGQEISRQSACVHTASEIAFFLPISHEALYRIMRLRLTSCWSQKKPAFAGVPFCQSPNRSRLALTPTLRADIRVHTRGPWPPASPPPRFPALFPASLETPVRKHSMPPTFFPSRLGPPR